MFLIFCGISLQSLLQRSSYLKLQKKNKLASELSKLIIYCCAKVKLPPEVVRSRGRRYYEMTSFNELAAERQMGEDPMFYVWYHEVQLSRIYPKGQRVDSSNYYPSRFWNFGCQLVSMNYQKPGG